MLHVWLQQDYIQINLQGIYSNNLKITSVQMGNFLLQIRGKTITIDQALLNCSHSKLLEYYSSYKSICDHFTITITEYIQIFGSNQKSFDVWDPKRKGKIDALQMFAGLITFSTIPYPQKIKFLFEVFDFNEECYLSYENVTFMLMNICNATYKIFSVHNSNAKLQEMESLVNEYFSVESEIQFEKLLRWSMKLQEIKDYFEIIDHPAEMKTCLRNIVSYEDTSLSQRTETFRVTNLFTQYDEKTSEELTSDQIQPTPFSSYHPVPSTTNQTNQNQTMLKLFTTLAEIITTNHQTPSKQPSQKFNPKIKWIYGIRIDDIREPIKYIPSQHCILYFIGKIVVMYYLKLNMQQYYCEHQQEVSVLEVSQNNQMAASAEMGINPTIHIWSVLTSKNLMKLKQIHKNSIKMLRFLNNDKYLVSISEYVRQNSPIIIINLQNKQVIMSTYLEYDVKGIIVPPFHLVSQGTEHKNVPTNNRSNSMTNMNTPNSNSVLTQKKVEYRPYQYQHPDYRRQFYFIVYSDHSVTYFSPHQLTFKLIHHSLLDHKETKQSNNQQSNIKQQGYMKQEGKIREDTKAKSESKVKSERRDGSRDEIGRVTAMIEHPIKRQLMSAHEGRTIRIWYYDILSHQVIYKPVQSQFQSSYHNPSDQEISEVDFAPTNRNIIQMMFLHPDILLLLDSLDVEVLHFQKGAFDIVQNTSKFSTKQLSNHSLHLKKHHFLGLKSQKRTLFNLELVSMVKLTQNSILVVSLFGDVIRVQNISPNQNNEFNCSFTKYYQIFKLQECCDGLLYSPPCEGEECLGGEQVSPWGGYYNSMYLSCNLLMLFSSNLMYVVDQYEKELICTLKLVSRKILCVDVYQKYLLIVFDDDHKLCVIYSLQDMRPIESFKVYEIVVSAVISQHYLILAIDHTHQTNIQNKTNQNNACICIFVKNGEKYFEKEPKRIKLNDLAIPVHISHCEMPKTYVIMCKDKQLYKLFIPNMNSIEVTKIQTNQEYRHAEKLSSSLSLIYPQQYHESQIVVDPSSKIMAMSQPNGEIYLWEGFQEIIGYNYHFENQHSDKVQLINTKVKDTQNNTIIFPDQKQETFTYEVIAHHYGTVRKIILHNHQVMVTIGAQDQMVLVYEHQKYTEEKEEEDQFQSNDRKYVRNSKEQSEHGSSSGQEENSMFNSGDEVIPKKNKNLVNKHANQESFDNKSNSSKMFSKYICDQEKQDDEILNRKKIAQMNKLRRYQYVFEQQNQSKYLRDSQLQIQSLKATYDFFNNSVSNNTNINAFQSAGMTQTSESNGVLSLKEILLHNIGLRVLKSQQSIGSNEDNNFYFNQFGERDAISRQKNSLHLELNQILGYNSRDVSNNAFYVHFYSGREESWNQGECQNGSRQPAVHEVDSEKLTSKELLFGKAVLLPFDECHPSCRRENVYTSDRVAVVFNPTLKKQRFYTHHRGNITSIAIHPSKKIISTCEMQYPHPLIHIWSVLDCNPIQFINTKHDLLIKRVQFSRDGAILISLGGHQSLANQSLQVTNWEYDETLSYIFLSKAKIKDLVINPYNSCEFAVCGRQIIRMYGLSERKVVIKQQYTAFEEKEELCCMVYTSSIFGNDIESDIITGNSQGDIGLYICGKYLLSKPKAHTAAITCLRIVELFKYKTILISAGEDAWLKMWDIKFNIITQINLKEFVYCNYIGKPQYSSIISYVQSLDIYQCLVQNHANQSNESLLLIGMCDGVILEAKISNQFEGYQKYHSETKDKQSIKEKVMLNLSFIIKSPSIDHQTLFQTAACEAEFYQDYLMLTYSQKSQALLFWKLAETNQSISTFNTSSERINGPDIVHQHHLQQIPQICKFLPSQLKSANIWLLVGFRDKNHIDLLQFSNGKNLMQRTASNAEIQLQSNFYAKKIEVSQTGQKIVVEVYPSSTVKHNNIINHYIAIFERVSTVMDKMSYEFKYKIDLKESSILSLSFSRNELSLLIGTMQQSKAIDSECEYILYDVNAGKPKKLELFNREKSNSNNFNNIDIVNRKRHHTFDNASDVSQTSNNSQLNSNDYFPQSIEIYPMLHAKYIPYDNIIYQQAKKDCLEKQSPLAITSILEYHSFIILGTRHGQLLVLDYAFVYGHDIVQLYDSLFTQRQNGGETFQEKKTLQKGINLINHHLLTNNQTLKYSETEKQSFYAKMYVVSATAILKMKIIRDQLYICSQNSNSIARYTLNQLYQQGQIKGEMFEKEENFQNRTKTLSIFKNNHQTQLNQFYDIIDDPFNEIGIKNHAFPSLQAFVQNKLKQIYPKRKNVSLEFREESNLKKQQMKESSKKQKSEQEDAGVELELKLILGRNSFYKRNNIFIDLKDNILSYSGCNLIIMKRESVRSEQSSSKKLKQRFLKLDIEPFSCYPEISVLCMSTNKRFIYAGTNQENSKILAWDISTKTYLYSMKLEGIVSISHLKVSANNQFAVAEGVNGHAQKYILFINLLKLEILAAYKFHERVDINDMAFILEENYRLIMCGNNYIAEWKYENGLLMSQPYKMDNPKDFIEPEDLQEDNASRNIIFYSIIFVEAMIITSASDGYLYIWKDKKVIKKQNAHPDIPILCLYTPNHSKIFLSGGIDGKVKIWHFGSSSIITNINEFSICAKENKVAEKDQIQSVCMMKKIIIVGNRGGQIFEFNFNSNEIEKNQEEESSRNLEKNERNNGKRISWALDNERINSCSFNTSSSKLYILTCSGNFYVFNLETYEKIRQEKIQFKSQLIKMLVCNISNKIFIILENSIMVFYNKENHIAQQKDEKACHLRKSPKEFYKSESGIKRAILSRNQKYLAILIAPNSVQNAKIQIYDLDHYQSETKFYALYKHIEDIQANIEIIDFSTDNGYLIYQSQNEEENIIDLLSKKDIKSDSIEFQLEWNDEAKKSSRKIRQICSMYSQENNQLLKLVQIIKKSIIATDEMGSIRIYKYGRSEKEKDKDISYEHIYIEHLNHVHICMVSSDNQVLVTVGREDRAIHIWKIKHKPTVESQ